MKCIVTGGLGFIGSHVVDELIKKKHEVFVIDNLSTGSPDNSNNKASYEIKDILDKKFISDFFNAVNPDWIFHLAALPRIQPSFDDPQSHDDANVRGTLNILEVIKTMKIKAFVNSSSSAVYGNPDMIPTNEKAAINPLSPYALQKYASERYLHIFADRYNLPIVSLRYFNPYGPRSYNEKNPFNAYTSVVGIFANQKKNGLQLTITGNGLQERDFIHVKDVALANILVAENIEKSKMKIFNVGNGDKISILNLARLFNTGFKFIPERKGEAEVTFADITELKKLGWKPQYNLKISIENGDI